MKDYTKKPLSIFVDYIRDEKKLFILDMCCAVLVSAVDLGFPYVSKNAMQTYLPQRMFTTFFVVMLILVTAYLLKSLLYYIITVLEVIQNEFPFLFEIREIGRGRIGIYIK